jgi:hypothetical protein
MGALIAGVGMSTFPYNLDVIAKVVNIRDFFVTLFFVALGMQIPVPTASAVGLAVAASAFLVLTRFVSLVPVLYAAGSGLRASLLPAINLSQVSEFSLVIASLGLGLGHVGPDTVAVLTFAFALTSVTSTYMIEYNHELQSRLGRLLGRLGLRERPGALVEEEGPHEPRLVLLGFYRDTSSIVHQFEQEAKADESASLLRELLVVDFNPVVLEELKRRGIRSLYGDLGSTDTLHHASLHGARLIACTLTDSILKGTSNARLLKALRTLAPEAMVVVAADTLAGALELYASGADFVFVPRIHSAHRMAEVLRTAMEDGLSVIRAEEMEALRERDEVLA